jgi:hypothetical protein
LSGAKVVNEKIRRKKYVKNIYEKTNYYCGGRRRVVGEKGR